MKLFTTLLIIFILISLNQPFAVADTLSVAGNEWTLVADIPGLNVPKISLIDGAVYNISVEGPGLKTKFVQPVPFRYIVLWEGSTNAHYFVSADNPITVTFTGADMYAFLVDVNNVDSSGELDILFESGGSTDTLSVAGNEWTLVADIPGQNMPKITLSDGAVYSISVEGLGLKTKFVQPVPFRYIVLWEGSTNAHYFVSADQPITVTFTGADMYAFLVDVNNVDSSGELDIIFQLLNGIEDLNWLANVPRLSSLAQNHPNPFNPVTTIKYSLSRSGDISLVIYNLLGEEVTRLSDSFHQAGEYEATWDASNVSSGIYFYRLRAGDFVQTRKMVLLK